MNESKDAFRRVQEMLLDGIRAGRWGPGDRLPSQDEIAKTLTVSRATVARVMARLRYAGLVVGPSGGAASVTEEPMRRRAFALFDEAAEIRRLNREAGLISPD